MIIEREPSGLYEVRRRAVEALQRLGAIDDLVDCLRTLSSREALDPVEQTGDDAVVNALARALSGCESERVQSLLLDLASHRHLAGVIEALGAFHCRAALPNFIEALADDFTRPAAEAAIRKIGGAARPFLIHTVKRLVPPGEREYPSRTRQRLSALALLAEFANPRSFRAILKALMNDASPAVAALAREIASRLIG